MFALANVWNMWPNVSTAESLYFRLILFNNQHYHFVFHFSEFNDALGIDFSEFYNLFKAKKLMA